jgi:hypothetical protein
MKFTLSMILCSNLAFLTFSVILKEKKKPFQHEFMKVCKLQFTMVAAKLNFKKLAIVEKTKLGSAGPSIMSVRHLGLENLWKSWSWN